MEKFSLLIPFICCVLGGYLAFRKKIKIKKREKLIDKCLEKYANEEKID